LVYYGGPTHAQSELVNVSDSGQGMVEKCNFILRNLILQWKLYDTSCASPIVFTHVGAFDDDWQSLATVVACHWENSSCHHSVPLVLHCLHHFQKFRDLEASVSQLLFYGPSGSACRNPRAWGTLRGMSTTDVKGKHGVYVA
jgi:hypothetical protein